MPQLSGAASDRHARFEDGWDTRFWRLVLVMAVNVSGTSTTSCVSSRTSGWLD